MDALLWAHFLKVDRSLFLYKNSFETIAMIGPYPNNNAGLSHFKLNTCNQPHIHYGHDWVNTVLSAWESVFDAQHKACCWMQTTVTLLMTEWGSVVGPPGDETG